MKKLAWKCSLPLCLSFLISGFAYGETQPAYDYQKEVRKIERSFQRGDETKQYRTALNFLIMRAVIELKLNGHHEDAEQLREEWKQTDAAFFNENRFGGLDLGDWDPMNEKLVEIHENLASKLPERVMEMTRLNDIKVFNYGLPVVLHPEDPRWDAPEFKLHFVPVAGSTAYWVTWGVCSMGTSGILSMIVCPIAGMAAERVTEKHVAPNMSDKVYERGQE